MSDNYEQYNSFEHNNDEDLDDVAQEKNSGNIKQQKIIFFGFLSFGIIALFLAFYQLRYNLRSPFFIDLSNEGDKELAQKQDDIFILQKKDTDKDGLSDYDELYVYYTSPYLEDSDSDGLADKIEIEENKNPNCPEGKDCGIYLSDEVATSSAQLEDIYGDLMNSGQGYAVDPQVLRQYLLEQGMPSDALNMLSDEELLSEYANAAGGQATPEGNINIDKEQLMNLSPAEIREILKSKGIDAKILESIDDETLKKDFLDTLNGL
ncbi:MAG: hypothetical protein V1860_03950 [bacterium]